MDCAAGKNMLFRLALSRYEQYGIEDKTMLKAIKAYVGIAIMETLEKDYPEYFTQTSTK